MQSKLIFSTQNALSISKCGFPAPDGSRPLLSSAGGAEPEGRCTKKKLSRGGKWHRLPERWGSHGVTRFRPRGGGGWRVGRPAERGADQLSAAPSGERYRHTTTATQDCTRERERAQNSARMPSIAASASSTEVVTTCRPEASTAVRGRDPSATPGRAGVRRRQGGHTPRSPRPAESCRSGRRTRPCRAWRGR